MPLQEAAVPQRWGLQIFCRSKFTRMQHDVKRLVAGCCRNILNGLESITWFRWFNLSDLVRSCQTCACMMVGHSAGPEIRYNSCNVDFDGRSLRDAVQWCPVSNATTNSPPGIHYQGHHNVLASIWQSPAGLLPWIWSKNAKIILKSKFNVKRLPLTSVSTRYKCTGLALILLLSTLCRISKFIVILVASQRQPPAPEGGGLATEFQ